METISENKKVASQVTFRIDAEKRQALEKAAEEKGMTVAEYLRSLAEQNLSTKKTDVKDKVTESKTTPDDGVIGALIRELSDKTNTTNDLLFKLVEIQTPSTSEDQFSQTEVDQLLADAVQQEEERLRSENLLLRLSEDQRRVLLNLLSFRKEKGKAFSDSIEELFFFMIRTTFYESWGNTTQPEFDSEFKTVFTEYFEKQ